MNLTRQEQETIITYTEAEQTAEVFTYRPSLMRQLDALCLERPDEAKHTRDNGDGGKTYIIPKSWVKIRPTRILSQAQRDVLARLNQNAKKTG